MVKPDMTADSQSRQKQTDGLLETINQLKFQNEMMLDWVNGAVVHVDREGKVVQANQTALESLGWTHDEFIGRHMHQTIHHSQDDGSEYPWDFCPVFAAIEDGSAHHVDGDIFWRKDGDSFSADFIVCPTRNDSNEIDGAVLTFRNLTDERMKQANQIHSLKLESIGELAAGIAHEINTPIQFIGSNVSFLQDSFGDLLRLVEGYRRMKDSLAGSGASGLLAEIDELEQDADIDYLLEEAPKAFEQTRQGVERVTELVLGLKGFAHSGVGEAKKPVDINEIIKNSLIVCHNAYKYVAKMETEYGDLPAINVYPGDIGQVIVNLIVNAAHAIAEAQQGENTGQGNIRISTRRDGDSLFIAISDTGTGIPEKIRQRIFDPFFTTKDVGKGSGQGLAISRTIIHDKHGGELSFDSTPGKGTTFTIRLPLHQG